MEAGDGQELVAADAPIVELLAPLRGVEAPRAVLEDERDREGPGIVAEERTIKGSYLGSCNPARDIPRYVAMYRNGRLPVDRLLSERVALGDINAAFDRLADGRSVRQVVEL